VLPIVVPGVYGRFPAALQIVLGNGLAMGALTAVIVNALFEHLHLHWRARDAADPAAHLEAAVNDNRSRH
jgi:xanthine/uracil permease